MLVMVFQKGKKMKKTRQHAYNWLQRMYDTSLCYYVNTIFLGSLRFSTCAEILIVISPRKIYNCNYRAFMGSLCWGQPFLFSCFLGYVCLYILDNILE
jgi:hypothetical protein